MKALWWLYWALYQAASMLAAFIGLFALLPLSVFGLWTPMKSRSKLFSGRQITAWRGGWLTILWGNDEDGVVPPTIVDDKPYLPHKPQWMRVYAWTALRNSANNMRLLPGASFLTQKDLIQTKTYSWGMVVSHANRQCVYRWGRRFGWLLDPKAGDGWRAWPVAEKL